MFRGRNRVPVLRTGLRALATCVLLATGSARAGWVNIENGPPGTQILAIAQGHRGEIGVATEGGAAIFDGILWQTVPVPLPGTFVRCLMQDSLLAWWFGTPSGLARLAGSEWTVYGPADGLPSSQVNALLEDGAGDVWVGTPAGIARRRAIDSAWDASLTSSLVFPEVRVLFEDHRRRLWVGTSEGVSVADPSRMQWQHFQADPNGLVRDSVFSIGEDRDGGIWIGTHNGVSRLDPSGAWTWYGSAAGVPLGDLNAIVRDSTGGLWIGGATGITRFAAGTFQPLSGPPGSPTTFGPLYSMLVDDPGQLWLGSAFRGLYRSDRAGCIDYVTPSGGCQIPQAFGAPLEQRVLTSNCLSDILQDAKGELWVASLDSGLVQLETNGRWFTLRAADGLLASDSASVVFEDVSRRLWVGTTDRGLSALDSTRSFAEFFSTAAGLPSDRIVSLFEDHAGAMWVGTADGVSYRSAGGWVTPLRSGVAGLVSPVRVDQVIEDGTLTIWLRTSAGLWSIGPERGSPLQHTTAEGLLDNQANSLKLDSERALYVASASGITVRASGGWQQIPATQYGGGSALSVDFDREDRLWVGRNTGASYREAGSWRAFTPVELGLSDVRQVLQDHVGRIWIASSKRGLAYWNGDEWRHVDRLSGLASTAVDEVIEDTQGRLWTRGIGGLTQVDADRTGPQTIFRLPQPAITSSRALSFAFGAAYDESADLEFETEWDGVRVADWSPATTYQQQDVPDGIHTFSVRARDWHRNQDPTAATVTFEVDATPPQAVLSAPLFRTPVRAAVAVVGEASDDRYRSHRVEARPSGGAAWMTLVQDTIPVKADTLAVWDTRSVPDGDYEIRLSVLDRLGLVGNSLVQVIVDNVAPFADVTSPVTIRAADGGDVFTTSSEVHAYFPPFGFDADVAVRIEPETLGGVPADPSDGATRVGPVWALSWDGVSLKQAGTLDMRVPAGESRPLTIYHEQTAGAWRRLGGSPAMAGAPLSVPLTAPGRYALFTGGAPVSSASLSGITLVPRAFSPRGSFGSTEMSIGFTLGRSAAVSIKVYDRSGRLLRVVADGVGMPAGDGILRWNGRDRDGDVVPEGLYLVTIEASGERETRTMAVVR